MCKLCKTHYDELPDVDDRRGCKAAARRVSELTMGAAMTDDAVDEWLRS